MRVDVKASAKVNLDLRLRGRRSDGYHNVQTVLQSVALADDVCCEAVEGAISIRCDAPGVPTDHRNLAWKAAAATWRALGHEGEPTGLRISLVKRIPTQSGLGGGSANAAAVVWAAQQVWQESLSMAGEHKVLASLGADVPFFRRGGTMLGVGRGDELIELPELPSYLAVIAVPGVGVSTTDAYRWFDERHPDGAGSEPLAWPATSAVWPSWLPTCVNDFEDVVSVRHREIGSALESLRQGGADLARLSGSGSAVFGLFEPARGAAAAESAAALRELGLSVFETSTLSRAEASFDWLARGSEVAEGRGRVGGAKPGPRSRL
jgi:4-diphosphocytidyl-2-C-methyl-D-erythritol kinase